VLNIENTKSRPGDPTFNLASLFAIHQDCKTLIDQSVRYNIYLFGIKEEFLHDEKYTSEKIKEELHRRDKKKHIALYEASKKS